MPSPNEVFTKLNEEFFTLASMRVRPYKIMVSWRVLHDLAHCDVMRTPDYRLPNTFFDVPLEIDKTLSYGWYILNEPMG